MAEHLTSTEVKSSFGANFFRVYISKIILKTSQNLMKL